MTTGTCHSERVSRSPERSEGEESHIAPVEEILHPDEVRHGESRRRRTSGFRMTTKYVTKDSSCLALAAQKQLAGESPVPLDG